LDESAASIIRVAQNIGQAYMILEDLIKCPPANQIDLADFIVSEPETPDNDRPMLVAP
jgi:hypothetical protein